MVSPTLQQFPVSGNRIHHLFCKATTPGHPDLLLAYGPVHPKELLLRISTFNSVLNFEIPQRESKLVLPTTRRVPLVSV